MQNLNNSSASNMWELIKNLVMVIVVIVALLLISYFISKLLQKNFEFADNLDLGKKDVPVSNGNSTTVQPMADPIIIHPTQPTAQPIVVQPTAQHAAAQQMAQQVTQPVVQPDQKQEEKLPVHDITGTCYVPITTYKKYQQITNPSSISEPDGYIGRDKVCYRNKIGDSDFVKRRFGCMACQVDNDTTKKHNYDGTRTNVISTCVYSDKADLENGIWDENMCREQCGKLKDSM